MIKLKAKHDQTTTLAKYFFLDSSKVASSTLRRMEYLKGGTKLLVEVPFSSSFTCTQSC